ncbi:assembly factor cbp4 [Penicillium capsulatum]|uniref:Cytochrome b mRNA-processing protein 4 n=1 Tax=Penicillium capsulatum TaxID=69766 RepID=A0A9W9M0F3_9EURO|nr:assembly factor cbp4 [Penicillium capsulatum]KAJ6129362.1 assembly factor cbp4 [Penicillium capsulatum]
MSQGLIRFAQFIGVTTVCVVGGNALVKAVQPTPEQLLARMSPEEQQRVLEEGPRKAKEFDEYVTNLKRWSKSDKSIWVAAQEEADARNAQAKLDRAREKAAAQSQKNTMRQEMEAEK